MAGNLYSAHFQATLGSNGAEVYCLYFATGSAQSVKILLIEVSCDFDSTAGDDPIEARFEEVTGTAAGGSSLTGSKHDTDNSIAAQATVQAADSITGLSAVANTAVWDTFVNPKDSFRPGLRIGPSKKYALALDPGAEAREAKISIWWEE